MAQLSLACTEENRIRIIASGFVSRVHGAVLRPVGLLLHKNAPFSGSISEKGAFCMGKQLEKGA